MNSNIIAISSIVIALCCVIGMSLPKLIKEEDERYGINALIIAFCIGFLINMTVWCFFN